MTSMGYDNYTTVGSRPPVLSTGNTGTRLEQDDLSLMAEVMREYAGGSWTTLDKIAGVQHRVPPRKAAVRRAASRRKK